MPCHPSIRPSVRPAVRPPTSLVIPSISTIAAAEGQGARGSVIGVNPRASGFDGSRVTMSAGPTKTLYRRVATSQIGASEAGRKRAIKGNNSGGGHIVPRASAALPWDGTAASYTRAIMNGEIASRFRSDANFPERSHDEEMKLLSSILIQTAVPSVVSSRSRDAHVYLQNASGFCDFISFLSLLF